MTGASGARQAGPGINKKKNYVRFLFYYNVRDSRARNAPPKQGRQKKIWVAAVIFTSVCHHVTYG